LIKKNNSDPKVSVDALGFFYLRCEIEIEFCSREDLEFAKLDLYQIELIQKHNKYP